ncbi:MAG: SufE family protein [Planctomycetes bacterium]|nr:SufE family protein [Planctomycetota bacterium]
MKLPELLAEFDDVDPEDALEILMEFAERLPPASAGRSGSGEPTDCRILECQTPVYLWVDLNAGHVHLEAVVPEKSPTVRGFVALLVEGLEGATAAEVAEIPDDFLPLLGLTDTLGMTRQRGFRGVVARIKREVAQKA